MNGPLWFFLLSYFLCTWYGLQSLYLVKILKAQKYSRFFVSNYFCILHLKIIFRVSTCIIKTLLLFSAGITILIHIYITPKPRTQNVFPTRFSSMTYSYFKLYFYSYYSSSLVKQFLRASFQNKIHMNREQKKKSQLSNLFCCNFALLEKQLLYCRKQLFISSQLLAWDM